MEAIISELRAREIPDVQESWVSEKPALATSRDMNKQGRARLRFDLNEHIIDRLAGLQEIVAPE